MLPNPVPYFSKIPDPRHETRNKLHKLEDILMITFCAVLSGYEDWVSIEDVAYLDRAFPEVQYLNRRI